MWRKTVSQERVSKIGDLSGYFKYPFDGRGNTSEQKHHMKFFMSSIPILTSQAINGYHHRTKTHVPCQLQIEKKR
jgi:hypothetical protein